MQLSEMQGVVKVKVLNHQNSCNLSYLINYCENHYIICKIWHGIEILTSSRTNLVEVIYYFREYDFVILSENNVIWIHQN